MPEEFNPAEGKLTVIGDNSAFVAGPYTVIFKKLPQTNSNGSYSRILEMEIKKDSKPLLSTVLGFESRFQNNQVQQTYFFELLEITGDSYTIRTYQVYPDLPVLGVAAIEYAKSYEKGTLNGISSFEFESYKRKIIQKVTALYPNSRFFQFHAYHSNFVFFQFEPEQNYYRHKVGGAFDVKNERIFFLTTISSVEKFFFSNRFEMMRSDASLISEKTVDLVSRIFSIAAINSYDRFNLLSVKDLLTSPYYYGNAKKEIDARIEKFKDIIKPPSLKGKNSIVVYTINKTYPSILSEWTITESKDKFTIKQKILQENFYIPDYVINDSISPEEGLNYIR